LSYTRFHQHVFYYDLKKNQVDQFTFQAHTSAKNSSTERISLKRSWISDFSYCSLYLR